MLEFKKKPCNCKENALNHCKISHLICPHFLSCLPTVRLLKQRKQAVNGSVIQSAPPLFLRQEPVTCRTEFNLEELFSHHTYSGF